MKAPTAVVVAPLGPNPAPLTELIWALKRQRDLTVRQVFVVTHPEGHQWLEREVLSPTAALDELRRVLGPDIVGPDGVDVRVVPGDDATEEDGRAWREAVWEAGRAAIEAAGTDTVVFGLLAGRRRTMTALETVIAQLLARPQDLCLDVRVSHREAEGGSGFFFPEQDARHLTGPEGPFDARDVEVILVDVPVPRLRGLLYHADWTSWEATLKAGQQAIDELQPPRLEIDLPSATIRAGGQPMPLAGGTLLHYAVLAIERQAGRSLRTTDRAPLAALAERVNGLEWTGKLRDSTWKNLIADDPSTQAPGWHQDVATQRSRTLGRVRRWCRDHHPGWERWLVPHIRHGHSGEVHETEHTLALPPDRIRVIDGV